MNREILFKAKRIYNGEWVEGSLLQTTAVSLKSFIVPSACYTFDKWDWAEWLHVDTDTICQWTGLLDRNGNKIWENDIVSVEYLYLGKRHKENAEVSYSKNGFVPFAWEYECDGCDLRCEILEVEVIGNKFDNPELLEGGAE